MTGAVAQTDWSSNSGQCLHAISRSLFSQDLTNQGYQPPNYGGSGGMGMYDLGGLWMQNHMQPMNSTNHVYSPFAASSSTRVSRTSLTQALPAACAMTAGGTQIIPGAWECSTSASGCLRLAVDLFPCHETGCNKMIHHVCQTQYESEDDTREAPLGYIYCPQYHPHYGHNDLTGSVGNDKNDDVVATKRAMAAARCVCSPLYSR